MTERRKNLFGSCNCPDFSNFDYSSNGDGIKGSLQLIGIGTMGKYVHRIYTEAKKKPVQRNKKLSAARCLWIAWA
jgi:hypothetical protein